MLKRCCFFLLLGCAAMLPQDVLGQGAFSPATVGVQMQVKDFVPSGLGDQKVSFNKKITLKAKKVQSVRPAQSRWKSRLEARLAVARAVNFSA